MVRHGASKAKNRSTAAGEVNPADALPDKYPVSDTTNHAATEHTGTSCKSAKTHLSGGDAGNKDTPTAPLHLFLTRLTVKNRNALAGQGTPVAHHHGGHDTDSSLTDPDPEPPIPPPTSPRNDAATSPKPNTHGKPPGPTKRKDRPTNEPGTLRAPAGKRTRTDDIGEPAADDAEMDFAGVPNNRTPERSAEGGASRSNRRGFNSSPEPEAHAGEDEDKEDVQGPGPATQQRQAVNHLLARWEGSIRQLHNWELRLNADAAAEVLANAEIGSAFVCFTGPGDIFSVVALETDPNLQGNLRALNEGHWDLLYEVLQCPNAKRDWEPPLFLSVPSHLITEELRAKMKAHSATDPLSTPPLLKLIREHQDEEIKLENKLWLECENERWLSGEELVECQQCLDHLRSSQECCMLLNSNHRIRAMLHGGEDIIKIRNDIKDHINKGDVSQEEISEMSAEMWERIEDHSWRCIMYDPAKLTVTAKTMLVRNQYEKPAMGMGLGEKAWWLAKKFKTVIQAELVSGASDELMDRAVAANIVQEHWQREKGSKKLMTGNEEEAEEVKMAQKSKKLGDLAGNDALSHLFFNRLGMDMVLDIQPALWVFKSLNCSCAIEMLHPLGALLLARFWLNARTLINVLGHEKHYMALHVKTERVPQLLGYYGDKQANKFADIFAKEFAKWRNETHLFLDLHSRTAIGKNEGPERPGQ
ncbi:hypothetical protein FRC06_000722 [Ceratobasidium sp. 370]|nr:hypothetical protein FRC06_000722 [Ceratobasidium sp. 370]